MKEVLSMQIHPHLLFNKVCGEQVGGNLDQTGSRKIQIKISRQISRVKTEPVIHHAGHAPTEKKPKEAH